MTTYRSSTMILCVHRVTPKLVKMLSSLQFLSRQLSLTIYLLLSQNSISHTCTYEAFCIFLVTAIWWLKYCVFYNNLHSRLHCIHSEEKSLQSHSSLQLSWWTYCLHLVSSHHMCAEHMLKGSVMVVCECLHFFPSFPDNSKVDWKLKLSSL